MTAEQQARDLLVRMGYEDAQSRTAGDVVELANIIRERDRLRVDVDRVALIPLPLMREIQSWVIDGHTPNEQRTRVVSLLRFIDKL